MPPVVSRPAGCQIELDARLDGPDNAPPARGTWLDAGLAEHGPSHLQADHKVILYQWFLVIAAVAVTAMAPRAQSLPTLTPLDASGRVTYFIAEGLPGSEFRPADRDLARWALEAWERSIGGALRFESDDDEEDALLRVRWVPASAGQYGEMRPLLVRGRRGAEVFIRPDMNALGPDISNLARTDPLLRDTIVYLTCLHELGHALGLAHTADFADIMYFFGYGGDIPGFFGRYREQLRSRADIPKHTGLSAADVNRVKSLYIRR